MRILLACTLLAATAAVAAPRVIPIDIDQDLGGLDIEVKSSSGAVTVVTLKNKSAQKADCRAEFEGGLATPVRRAAMVQPGKTSTLSYTLKDDIARLRVTLRCKPA
jgi:hypothetical protein